MSDGHQPAVLSKRGQFGSVNPDADPPKKVTLYVNGDAHFHGETMTVNRRLMQTWDTFLRKATERTGVVFAARDILTPTHGTKVNSLEELVDGSSYVVISKGNFKPTG